jgi:hypothetical protein
MPSDPGLKILTILTCALGSVVFLNVGQRFLSFGVESFSLCVIARCLVILPLEAIHGAMTLLVAVGAHLGPIGPAVVALLVVVVTAIVVDLVLLRRGAIHPILDHLDLVE